VANSTQSLFQLLKGESQELIQRWVQAIKATIVTEPLPRSELLDHVPAFVEELVAALFPDAMPLPGGGSYAEEHGSQRLRLGFDVGEVVREYGLLHACILQLADERGVSVSLAEHLVVARWLNTGIAQAVSQYALERNLEIQRQASEHLGFMAHELRDPLSAARLALHRLRLQELSQGGRTVDLLERNLKRTADMIDTTLTHASLKLGVAVRPEPLRLRDFLDEIRLDSAAEAQIKHIEIQLSVPEDLVLEADPRLLRSAVTNLMLNAVKFTPPEGHVSVSVRRHEGRLLIEVSDSCGGLPPGKVEELFAPLVQRAENRTGFGLGLSIALQATEAHNGTIRVTDLPGHGCVFIIDLPDRTVAPKGED
jgi:signal transduction histidine kinase